MRTSSDRDHVTVPCLDAIAGMTSPEVGRLSRWWRHVAFSCIVACNKPLFERISCRSEDISEAYGHRLIGDRRAAESGWRWRAMRSTFTRYYRGITRSCVHSPNVCTQRHSEVRSITRSLPSLLSLHRRLELVPIFNLPNAAWWRMADYDWMCRQQEDVSMCECAVG